MHARTHARTDVCTRADKQASRQAVRQVDEGEGERAGRGGRICRTSTHQHVRIRGSRARTQLVADRTCQESSSSSDAHAYTIALVHARECEITRGDGRGQRLRATWVLEARRESESGTRGETGEQAGGGGRDGKRRRSWGLLLPRIRQRPKGEIGR